MGIFFIDDIWNAVSGVFTGVAGWAIDSVVATITAWVLGGVLALIEAIWSVIDMSTNPMIGSDWYSATGSTPFEMALRIGGLMLSLTVLAAVIRAVLAGSPGGVARVVGRDLPMALFTMVGTIGFTHIGLRLSNAMSDWVWQGTRDDAKQSLDVLAQLLRSGLPALQFVAVASAVVLLVAMLFLWVVLYVREALVFLVVVFAAAFAWPMMVFRPLRDTAKKAFELLVALIICKPVITLALSVGVSAMTSFGANESANPVRELGTMVAGVIVFGLAAFMPFLVWKLMPLVAAAVVAQGVASGPMRATQSAMSMQYYGRQLASGGRVPGKPPGGGIQASDGPTSPAGGAGPKGKPPGAGGTGGGSIGAAGGAGLAGVAAAGVSVAASAARSTAHGTVAAATGTSRRDGR